MKKFVVLFLVMALLLTGCSEVTDDPAIRADAELLLNAFVAADLEVCRAVVSANVSDEDLQNVFEPVCAELAGLGAYEMTAVNWKRTVSNDSDVTVIRYLIQGEGGNFYMDVAKTAGVDGVSGFQFSAAAANAEPTTAMGTVHYIFAFLGAAVLAFTLWMAWDCFRRKVKRKWLWILLILLGMAMFTFTMRDGGVNFRFSVGLHLGMTKLDTFAAGGFRFTAYIPVAAIVYFFKRKSLTPKVEENE